MFSADVCDYTPHKAVLNKRRLARVRLPLLGQILNTINMAKASGSTRTKYPSKSKVEDYISESQYKSLVDAIAKNDIPNNDLWEQLSKEQQELALMEAGFSGAITDDLENGTVYIEEKKDDLVSSFQEDLVNEMQGYGMDDSTSWTILYKDGSKKYLSHDMENDFDTVHITKDMYKQAYNNAKSALQISKVAAIIKSDGYDQPRYYVAKGGEKQMHDYGFEFWKKGRGEKKRNYIQDDWI